MPLRLIREDIITSDRIDQLDFPAEVFYRRLMNKVDDYGLFDARPSILRTSLYPLRVDRVREADIARWIAACDKAGVIALYEHGGKPFLQMLDTKWQTRSEPKYPLPPWGKSGRPGSPDGGCKQLRAVAQVDGDVFEDVDEVEKDNTGVLDPTEGFDAFWKAWPSSTRKAAKAQCLEKWQGKGLASIAATVIEHVAAMAKSEQWTKDKGQFVPAPLVYLNQARWEAPTEAQAVAAQEAERWQDTRAGVDRKAAELGMPDWPAYETERINRGHVPHYALFKNGVLAAAGERAAA